MELDFTALPLDGLAVVEPVGAAVAPVVLTGRASDVIQCPESREGSIRELKLTNRLLMKLLPYDAFASDLIARSLDSLIGPDDLVEV